MSQSGGEVATERMTVVSIKRPGRTAIGGTTHVPEQNINVHGDVKRRPISRGSFRARFAERATGRRFGGLGIDAQRAAVARFGAAEGYEVVGEFVEIETGKGADAIERRPQLAAALAEARRHGNAPSRFPSSIASAETSISFPA